jgi:hypothetical protein
MKTLKKENIFSLSICNHLNKHCAFFPELLTMDFMKGKSRKICYTTIFFSFTMSTLRRAYCSRESHRHLANALEVVALLGDHNGSLSHIYRLCGFSSYICSDSNMILTHFCYIIYLISFSLAGLNLRLCNAFWRGSDTKKYLVIFKINFFLKY